MSGDKLFSMYPDTQKKKKKASTKDLGEVGGRIFDIIIHYNEFCELAFSESL